MNATAVEIAAPGRSTPVRVGWVAVEAVLAVVVLALWAWTFVGLGRSSYWIDELWTLFVVDRQGGLGEVLSRALTDTHPPLYYASLHYWTRLFGDSETATRSLSALCAVAAGVLFVACNGGAFSRAARLFGAAAGASSFYWFKQSQNARSYALCMLILTALLSCAAAARRRSQAGEPVSWSLCVAIAALGLAGAFTHYYLLLAVGLLYLALLVGVPDRRLRLTVLLSGGAILAAVLAYMRVAKSHLIFTNLWFSNAPDALADAVGNSWDMVLDDGSKLALLVLAAGALFGLLRRSRAPAAERGAAPSDHWIAGVSLFLMLGLAALGLAVSLLVQPSFSARNLLIAAPCAWFLAAWIYDRGVEAAPSGGLVFAGLATALMTLELLPLNGRLLNRTEDWRGSAQYVEAQTACRGRDIPVVLPEAFGPDTPFFRRLAEHDLFGRYYRGGGRLIARTKGELAGSRDAGLTGLLGARASGADPCPVLAWGVHDIHDSEATSLAQALARRPEVGGGVAVHRIPSYRRVPGGWRLGWPAAYVFERAPHPIR
jgi:hypothetical protein